MLSPSSQKIDTKPNFYLTQTISAIIPAYNEASGITGVINVIRSSAFINEIIVVDDGSGDQTGALALEASKVDPRIQVITHPINRGKGQAFFSGVSACKNSIVITVDADLIGLKPEHIYSLVKPVLESQADMTLGIFRGGSLITDLSHWATPWLSGQRCFRLEMLRHVSRDAAAGYGLETAISVAAKQRDWRVDHIIWRGVSHPPSEFHRGRMKGIMARICMYSQILRAWYIATSRQWVGKYLKSPLGFLLYLMG
jgi:glycosyltransferase involved in cell wall biosynthesis